MERAAQSDKASQQQPAAVSGVRGSVTRSFAPRSSRLGQFAAGINSSPRVQKLAQMKEGIQRSPRVESFRQLAEQMQPGAPAQLEEQPAPNRTGLPDQVKSGVENLSGFSLDDVKIHYNSDKPAQLNALAYAQGTDIHVAPGQEKHLPHEAWHIVQQKQGRVRPTIQMKGGVPVNEDRALEHEADVMGGRAAGAPPAQGAAVANPLRDVPVSDSGPAQLVPQKKAVTGITHLVEMTEGGSVFEGKEVLEVEEGMIVEIAPDRQHTSRRGPNQEAHREVDRTGPVIYEWYRVLSVDDEPMGPNVFIREDTFRPLSWEEMLKDLVPASLFMGDEVPEEIYDLLGPADKWKEHIDASHHRFGEDVYIAGKHGKKPDPKYNQAMMDADRYVRGTFGRHLTFQDYDNIHHLASPDKNDQFGLNFRLGELPIGTRENRFNSPVENLKEENVPPFGGQAGLPPLIKEFNPAQLGERAKVVLADVRGSEPGKEFYSKAITGLLNAYYAEIDKAESSQDKLAIITHLHKSLENLHPYGDANTRTNRLVLNRMLAEQGLPLTMLEYPLDVHHTKEADWMEHIQEGQQRWQTAVAEKGSQRNVKGEWTGWERGLKEKIKIHEEGGFQSRLRGLEQRPTSYRMDAPQLNYYPEAPQEGIDVDSLALRLERLGAGGLSPEEAPEQGNRNVAGTSGAQTELSLQERLARLMSDKS
jgi:Domain of unknown function (DUF4157)/Fic/DOC family